MELTLKMFIYHCYWIAMTYKATERKVAVRSIG